MTRKQWMKQWGKHQTAQLLFGVGCTPLAFLPKPPKGANNADKMQWSEYRNSPHADGMWYVPNESAVKLYYRHNGVNRTMKVSNKEQIKSSILLNCWKALLDFLRFLKDCPTMVVDGQTRLCAVAESGYGALFLVQWDCTWDDILEQVNKNPDHLPQALSIRYRAVAKSCKSA